LTESQARGSEDSGAALHSGAAPHLTHGAEALLRETHHLAAPGSQGFLTSPMLKEIVDGSYVHPDQCQRLIRNEGIVILILGGGNRNASIRA
jgi:hypothetical protein